MSLPVRFLLLTVAWIVVAFGQPGMLWWFGPLAACVGYALVWRVSLFWEKKSHRAVVSGVWFTCVTATQLTWLLSHEYGYIYAVWVAFSVMTGGQFAVVSLLISPRRLRSLWLAPVVGAAWVVGEWARLFLLSGYTWNPVGLSLASNVYSLQMASLWGVYGLSFWVMVVNVLALQAWMLPPRRMLRTAFAVGVCIPYFYGAGQLVWHQQPDSSDTLSALVVQPNFPVKHEPPHGTPHRRIYHTLGQWSQILDLIAPHREENIDLLVLPEYVVEMGTDWPVYRHEAVQSIFAAAFGSDVKERMPAPQSPVAEKIQTQRGAQWMVSNAYIAQSLADLTEAHVVVGLQDEEGTSEEDFHTYTSAQCFAPACGDRCRYNKQVLLPMGEYIPGAWCRGLAKRYGVVESFSPGTETKVLSCGCTPFGVCVCYEETFGDLMRQNRLLGAQMLVNITNDAWYPNSRLPRVHFEHARLRTVEMGVPLVRAANNGVSGAIDSLGRDTAVLSDANGNAMHEQSGALRIDVPLHHYHTLYTQVGDGLVVGLAILTLFLAWRMRGVAKL